MYICLLGIFLYCNLQSWVYYAYYYLLVCATLEWPLSFACYLHRSTQLASLAWPMKKLWKRFSVSWIACPFLCVTATIHQLSLMEENMGVLCPGLKKEINLGTMWNCLDVPPINFCAYKVFCITPLSIFTEYILFFVLYIAVTSFLRLCGYTCVSLWTVLAFATCIAAAFLLIFYTHTRNWREERALPSRVHVTVTKNTHDVIIALCFV